MVIKFSDLFREKYSQALQAAKKGDSIDTKRGLVDIYKLFEEHLDNNMSMDKLRVQSELLHWKKTFAHYINIVDKFGVTDERIQQLFGLAKNSSSPTMSDLLAGNKRSTSDGQISSEGLFSDNPHEIQQAPEQPQTPEKQPQQQIPEIQQQIIPSGQPSNEPPQTSSEPPRTSSEFPNTHNSSEPQSLDEFIGQSHIISRLKAELEKAEIKGEKRLDNILLLGNRGLGKTTLMQLIAKALGVRYEFIDCSQFVNSAQSQKAIQLFFQNLAKLDQPVFIGMDEIHATSDDIQTGLLTLLQSREFVYMDKQGRNQHLPIKNFTFCGCTTNAESLLGTIKDRCQNLTFQLEPYSPDELRQIFINNFAALDLTVSDDALAACIQRCRSSLRELKAFVSGIETIAITSKPRQYHVTVETANKYFELAAIDPIGLKKKDIEILRTLQNAPDHSLGADSLAAKVGLTVKKLTAEYEPFLEKINLISKSHKGRTLTQKAHNYLNPQQDNQQSSQQDNQEQQQDNQQPPQQDNQEQQPNQQPPQQDNQDIPQQDEPTKDEGKKVTGDE